MGRGKYDKEIAAAKKIGEKWVKESESYLTQLKSIKKDHLAMEKKILRELSRDVHAGKHVGLEEELLSEIESAQPNLEMYYREGESRFVKHERWALKEPRGIAVEFR